MQIRKSWLVVAALATVVAACEIPEDMASSLSGPRVTAASPEIAFQSGKDHLREGRYGLALEKFKVVLAEAPASVRVLNAVGTAYDKLGRGDVAETYYKRALEMEPDSSQTLNNFGYSLILRGRHEEALPFLWKAANAIGADGRSLVAVRNYKSALKNLEIATGPKLEQVSLGAVRKNSKVANRKACQVGPVWLEKSGERVYSLITDPSIKATAAIKKLSGPYDVAGVSGENQHSLNCGSIVRAAYGVVPRVSDPQSRTGGAVQHIVTEIPDLAVSSEALSGPGGTKAEVAGVARASVEMSNGAGREFLARRLGSYFGTKGLRVDRLTNAKHFNHGVTTIFYRKGYLVEAMRYNNKLPFKVELKVAETIESDIRIRLGRDILEFDSATLMSIDNKLSLLLDSWT
jgi:LytR cell envelope-related transcriptional attenuator/Tetratricopeptide repeat